MFNIRTDLLLRNSFQFIRFHSSKASSKKWLQRQKADHYTKEAQFQDYKSRAAFKLLQIDDKYDIFKSGQNVVDLGFAPGAWTQVATKRVEPNGNVLGVDIIPANPPKGASAIQANILSKQTHVLIRNYFLDPKNQIKDHIDDIINHPSYIEAELRDNPSLTKEQLDTKSKFPIDVVLSDMYDPILPPERSWNNTTNIAFYRMANTSGLIAKDHMASIVS
ncbi:hypothetical protein BN7_5262 [Wickerhamomyces ciferrii]|uniref:rRNA methyltransferase 2, mitochondrial n=1 Tax=Wickerhamomyces ciferrii (strain ATCC 14091 / BCRC 22168 / CBS 111 / JCM 3599 / NBRC 0793 / NRRL Y-1031 F-60-10) TaxID=1206466 RepID=K0KUS3_WICCF|nr:uncharacterized protein BN7_5262 [Wickerhamomyces ciferrii]CCH45677.1 hypothetical protein BN7_5262 [Wickerhamomyces ciferrii]